MAGIRGYEAWRPVLHQSGLPSKVIYQLVFWTVAKPGLAKEEKVQPEWFGTGRFGGFREILVSNKMARLILENGWRGVALKPVELV